MNDMPTDHRRVAAEQTLRLTLVTETYPPEINGVANTLLHYAHGLSARGHSVQVIRPRQRRCDGQSRCSPVTEELVKGFRLPMYKSLQLGIARPATIERALRRFNTQAVYIATEGPLGLAAMVAARRLKLPVISGFHTNFHDYCNAYRMRLAASAVGRYLSLFHNRAAMTLVPTQDMVERLHELGVRKVSLLRRGVDAELFHPAKRSDELRRQWGVSATDKVCLYVGRLAAEKNIQLIEKLSATALAKHPGTRFVFVGDGPERARLQREHPEFIFCGPKTGHELARHYASADLFLFPSVTDTFGNVVLEAMVSGLVAMGYNYAAPAALIRHGHNGYLATLGSEQAFAECLEQALALTTAGMEARKQSARSTTESYSWLSQTQKLESLFLSQIYPENHDARTTHSELAESAGNSGLRLF